MLRMDVLWQQRVAETHADAGAGSSPKRPETPPPDAAGGASAVGLGPVGMNRREGIHLRKLKDYISEGSDFEGKEDSTFAQEDVGHRCLPAQPPRLSDEQHAQQQQQPPHINNKRPPSSGAGWPHSSPAYSPSQ